MVYNLIISQRAEEHMDNITGYLGEKLYNEQAAFHFVESLSDVFDNLENNPFQYSECKDPYLKSKNYRKAVLLDMNYVVIFRVNEDTVYIAGIFHNLENYNNRL